MTRTGRRTRANVRRSINAVVEQLAAVGVLQEIRLVPVEERGGFPVCYDIGIDHKHHILPVYMQ